jgi:hypothetical protein
MNFLPPGLEYFQLATISIFSENLRRFSQLMVHHRINDTGSKLTTAVVDTGGKFIASFNDSGGGKCATDVNDTGGNCPTVPTVNDTGGQQRCLHLKLQT